MKQAQALGVLVIVALSCRGGAQAAPARGALRQRGVASPSTSVAAIAAIAAPDPDPDAPDGITLQATHGSTPQDVSLNWTGDTPPYQVYRSSSPQDVATPAHRLGQTTNAAWLDSSASGSMLFYLVTHPTCPNVINDGGFEAGPFGGVWTEASTNFGTPICNASNCGQAPRSGIYWAWFGGVLALEDASASQSVVIAPAFATLSFWFSIPSCESFSGDTFTVDVDGTTVFSANSTDPTCFVPSYRQVSVDISAFANGASHIVRFRSHTNDIIQVTNFMVDDVRLEVCP